jgi:PAS domain S-box-containing protein
MKDQDRTKEELVHELDELRERIAELESSLDTLKQQQEPVRSLSPIDDNQNLAKEKAFENFLVHAGLIEKASVGFCVCHDVSEKPYVRFTHWNPLMTEITGYTMEEINQSGWYQALYPDPEVCQRAAERMERMRNGDDLRAEEWVITTKDGKQRPVSISTSLVGRQNGQTHILAIIQDMSEWKRVEEALQQKVIEMGAFINNLPDMAWLKDINSNFIAANKAFADAVGMAPEYLVNHTCEICFGEEAARKFKEEDERVMVSKKQEIIEESIIDVNRNTVWLETIKSPILDASGKVIGTVGIARNITKRKRAEEDLKRAKDELEIRVQERTAELKTANEDLLRDIAERKQVEEELDKRNEIQRTLLSAIPAYVYIKDTNSVYVIGNQRFSELSGIPEDEISGKTDYDIFSRTDADCFRRDDAGIFATGKAKKNYEVKGTDREGNPIWYSTSKVPLRNTSGQVTGLVGICLDITERKNMEESLRESEERYRELVESSNDIVFQIDTKGFFTFVNQVATSITGYSKEELVGLHFTDLIVPDYKEETAKFYGRQFVKKTPGTYYEFPFKTKNGEVAWVGQNVQPITRDDQIVGFQAIARDITERRRLEEEKDQTFSLLRATLESTADGILVVGTEGQISSFNGKFVRMWHIPKEVIETRSDYEALGVALSQLKCPEDFLAKVRDLYGKPDEESFDVLEFKDGRIFERYSRPQRLGERIMGRVWSFRDVTKHRQAQVELSRKTDLLTGLLESVPDIVFFEDLDGVYLGCNPEFARYVGRSQEEIVGRTDYDLVPTEIADFYRKNDRLMSELGKPRRNEEWIDYPDGHRALVDTFKAPLRSVRGEIIGVIGISRDITDRKVTEERLRESEGNFRTFFETLDDMIIVGTVDGRIMYTNPAMSRKLGYSPDELKDMHVLDVHPRKLRSEAETIFADMFRGKRKVCPLPLESKSGLLIPVETRCWFGKWSGIDCIFGVCKDLSREQEALQKFDRFFRNNPALMAVSTIPERKFTEVNGSFLNTLGFTREEIIGKTSAELDLFVQPEMQQAIAESLEKYGRVQTLGLKVRRKDGTILDGLFSGEVIESQGQKMFLTVMVDTTDRKKAEEALAESEERFRLFMDFNPVIAWMKDEQGRHVYLSATYERRFGVRYEDWRGKTDFELWPQETAKEFWKNDQAVLSQNRAMELTETTFEPNGEPCHWWNFKFPFQDSSGKRYVGGVGIDITDRKRMEKMLIESEEKYHSVFDNAAMGINLKLPDGTFLEVNQALADILGYDRDELANLSYLAITHPDDVQVSGEMHAALERGDIDTYRIEKRYIRKDQGVVWVDTSVRSLRDSCGKLVCTIGITADITARKMAEEALRESEEKIRTLINAVPDNICLKDGEGRWLEANDADLKMFELENVQYQGKKDSELADFSDFYRDAFLTCEEADEKAWATGGVSRGDEVIPVPDGSSRVFDVIKVPLFHADGSRKGLVVVGRDITQQRLAENLLLQSERFRAVADLAGGVAHNFNNLLHIVMGYLELALTDLDLGNYSDVKDGLRKVLESSGFGVETVRRLQSFAGIRDHSQLAEKGVFDLSYIVRQAVEMSKTWWKTLPEKEGRDVSLDARLQEGCLIRGEKNELFEVVVNLIKNATEALPQGGSIDIRTHVEGERVVFRIKDTGIGISQENLKRLFNPFFTTKAAAGSGLGLASSRKIIEDHGGNIIAESAEGNGTTFTFRLPLAEQPSEQVEAPAPAQQVAGPGKTILVIDDIESVLDPMKSGLTRSGHVVVTATSGQQGLDIFKENPIDVVICDLGMPGINGWEVGKRIRSLCEERGIPKTPFILLTGWGGQKTEAENIAESGVDAVAEKPVNIRNTLELIRQIVEREPKTDSH